VTWRARSGDGLLAAMIGWATCTLLGLCVAVVATMALVGSTSPRASSSAEGTSSPSQERRDGKAQPAIPVEADKGTLSDD